MSDFIEGRPINFRLGFGAKEGELQGVPVIGIYDKETDAFIVQLYLEGEEVEQFQKFFGSLKQGDYKYI